MGLYQSYQAMNDLMAPARGAAQAALWVQASAGAVGEWPLQRRWFALMDLLAHSRITHKRPSFGIDHVMSGGREIAVHEETVLSLPFGTLLHFARHDPLPKPKMLVVAPLSGHFATLLRSTVRTLLRDHDVYITDWANARDVPVAAGSFGFEDYVSYVIRFIEELGSGVNLLAVCQPCVQTLAAVAIMAADRHHAQPRTMTLMGGPIDVRAAPTSVNEFATAKAPEWFRENLISRVPLRYPGRGREVYPGFLQLTAFMSMNMGRHTAQHVALYQALADGDAAKAATIKGLLRRVFRGAGPHRGVLPGDGGPRLPARAAREGRAHL